MHRDISFQKKKIFTEADFTPIIINPPDQVTEKDTQENSSSHSANLLDQPGPGLNTKDNPIKSCYPGIIRLFLKAASRDIQINAGRKKGKVGYGQTYQKRLI